MGKAQKKTGKGRIDKYYKLAKEQGYRARSAFKLIQLNKKYNFLESARCCIDLCAAPGGWLQVASKYMPQNSVIVGVDLVPIKPIPRVVSFTSDITTPQCRNLIRGELKDWKADVVLHDGAPNVGTAWVQDAYSQSELVLMSLKLAVEFLIKGGTFITKVFRSADYNSLLWVFGQLFAKVEATKPPSSRNVSAEIFVVCRDFLAPKQIDPKFLDPKHVFKMLSSSSSVDKGASSNNFQANVFQPEKKRRRRDGYEDGDYTLFKEGTAADFIRGMDPVSFLGSVNKISFKADEEQEWRSLDLTKPEVLANCEDLKVLGKGDFKALIRWRTALREELGLDVKTKPTEELTETVEVTEEVDEEQQIQEELERLNAESAARRKRERRRGNEVKQRTIQRMQLQMTAPLDIGLEFQDQSLGLGQDDVLDLEMSKKQLGKQKTYVDLVSLVDDKDGFESDEEEQGGEVMDEDEGNLDPDDQNMKVDELEAELDGLYDAYQERLNERDAKYRVKEARRKDKSREEWHGFQRQDDDSDDSEESEGGYDVVQAAKARFGEDSDSDWGSESGDDPDTSSNGGNLKRWRGADAETDERKSKKAKTEQLETSWATSMWFDQDVFAGVDMTVSDDEHGDEGMHVESDDEDVDEEGGENAAQSEASESSEDDFEVVPPEDQDEQMWDVEHEDQDEINQSKIKKYGLLTEEAVSIAHRLVNRETTKTHLINDGFNRYSLNSKEGLPAWFLDDEGKHYKSNIPITKEAVDALRARQRALDARPIKKIAEAKARKKLKATQRLEKAMKKAEGVQDASDLSERAKAQQIEKLMRRGVSKGKPKKDIKVVVAKGSHKGLKGRPKGVKGRYKMVDSRMKKEVRAAKRKDKASKKRKSR
ncbi:FtsJ-domain-containing protein [Thelephora terrestris]|uniref:FtsJ-domain-containing protein n=1 Tax=Thelephora terrestris TaxID=56493 RepID=A0A9P6L8W5_9AGAM|nr:FtsJ-domain-containing protein [Thelephora terrestris]